MADIQFATEGEDYLARVLKEQSEARIAGEEFGFAVIDKSKETLSALAVYAQGKKQVSEASTRQTDEIESALNDLAVLNRQGLFGKIVSNLSGDYGEAASRLSTAGSRLRVIDRKQAQVEDQFRTATLQTSILTESAKAGLDKELRDVQFLKEEINTKQAIVLDQLRAEDRKLTITSLPDLRAAEAKGEFTKKQIDQVEMQRSMQQLGFEKLTNAVTMQDKQLAEQARQQLLQYSGFTNVEMMYNQAMENGGTYTDPKNPAVFYSSTELGKRLGQIENEQLAESSDYGALLEGKAAAESVRAKMDSVFGTNTEGLDDVEAFKVFASENSYLSESGRKAARETAFLLEEIKDNPNKRFQAALMKTVNEKLDAMRVAEKKALLKRYPKTDTIDAISQFWEGGRITDQAGADILFADGSRAQNPIGIGAYDRVLAGVYKEIGGIKTLFEASPKGWMREFRGIIKTHNGKLRQKAFSADFVDVVKQGVEKLNDPELLQMLDNRDSELYDARKVFVASRLGRKLMDKDPSGNLNRVFANALYAGMKAEAQKIYAKRPLDTRASVVKAAIDLTLFGNNAAFEFEQFGREAIRTQILNPKEPLLKQDAIAASRSSSMSGFRNLGKLF